jgi:hypothetical protein
MDYNDFEEKVIIHNLVNKKRIIESGKDGISS